VGCSAIDTGVSKDDAPQPARTQATARRSSWPGWIWAIPIAALLLIGWWVLRSLTRGGEDVTISFNETHGLKQDSSNLEYRGMKVGKVSEVKLAKDGKTVDVTVHVDAEAEKFVTSGTQFWLRGAEPSFSDLSSLSAIVSGPTIVMEPGPGNPQKHFVGRERRPIVAGAQGEPALYGISFRGDVGKLKQGEPVKLRGFNVGEVREIGFRYDATTGEIATPVTVALYPALFHIEGDNAAARQAALATAISALIGKGLHARLERDPPVIGNEEVVLEMAQSGPGAVPAPVDGVPQIPAEEEGGAQSIISKVNKLPIDQIAQNVLDITRHVDTLAASPKLADAINQLDATVDQIRKTADAAGPKITALVESLRNTAAQLRQAAAQADNVLGGTPNQNGMQKTLNEITEAARSLRDLADYLDRHPEALIKGRTGE
jgi:paraquat-inducible protein B